MTLHNHSEHSFLDGRARCQEMAEAAKANGDEALAICDHDEVGGHLDFQKACARVGVKPILGTEARWVHSVARGQPDNRQKRFPLAFVEGGSIAPPRACTPAQRTPHSPP